MKKIKINVFITTIVFAICLTFIYNSALRHGDVVFSMTDSKYDDNGAGKIKYPLNSKDEKGLFDITKFDVIKNNDDVVFKYKVSNLNNKYNNKNEFSNILIDTYISVSDEGLLTTLDYGAAITFNESYPWMYHIRISPDEYYIEKISNVKDRTTERLESSLKLNGNELILSTDIKNIDENLKDSKYYVFSGGYDAFGSDNYRRIGSTEDEWGFYGGINSLYQPNILDVVSPIQEKMLIFFMPPVYAVLSPVYNQIHQLIFRKELLYIICLIGFGFKYLSLYTKYRDIKKSKLKENETLDNIAGECSKIGNPEIDSDDDTINLIQEANPQILSNIDTENIDDKTKKDA